MSPLRQARYNFNSRMRAKTIAQGVSRDNYNNNTESTMFLQAE